MNRDDIGTYFAGKTIKSIEVGEAYFDIVFTDDTAIEISADLCRGYHLEALLEIETFKNGAWI